MKKFEWEEIAESQDFEHGQEFVLAEDAYELQKKMKDLCFTLTKLQTVILSHQI